jgi:hypothetical protein
VSTTLVLAPIAGRAVPLGDVRDPVFSAGMVGYGAAVDPARTVVDAVAPVGGRLLKLMPHAYSVMTPDNVSVLTNWSGAATPGRSRSARPVASLSMSTSAFPPIICSDTTT